MSQFHEFITFFPHFNYLANASLPFLARAVNKLFSALKNKAKWPNNKSGGPVPFIYFPPDDIFWQWRKLF